MKVRLFDSEAEVCIGVIEVPCDTSKMPYILRTSPNPVKPDRYFIHFGLDQYYEITACVTNLGNCPILEPLEKNL